MTAYLPVSHERKERGVARTRIPIIDEYAPVNRVRKDTPLSY